VKWLHTGLLDAALPAGGYDLVSALPGPLAHLHSRCRAFAARSGGPSRTSRRRPPR
jgi:hypothetical protein